MELDSLRLHLRRWPTGARFINLAQDLFGRVYLLARMEAFGTSSPSNHEPETIYPIHASGTCFVHEPVERLTFCAAGKGFPEQVEHATELGHHVLVSGLILLTISLLHEKPNLLMRRVVDKTA